MASATASTASRPAATIVNLTDAGLCLPTFYLTENDEKNKENPQKIVLGASCDRDEADAVSPDLVVNRYAIEALKKNAIFRGALAKRLLDVRAPSLDVI